MCLPISFLHGLIQEWLADSFVEGGLPERAGDRILQENCLRIFLCWVLLLLPIQFMSIKDSLENLVSDEAERGPMFCVRYLMLQIAAMCAFDAVLSQGLKEIILTKLLDPR